MSGSGSTDPVTPLKEDLVVFIVKSTEFAQVSKSTIEKIIEKRKENKGPQKQPASQGS
ncbi:hypothetical protein EDB85DRAFT_2137224 [Lactarius pseudohatsudake]|nr:hypothetical protein EDB85DRAFT_2137224 [Lactarius pseudohatsudake]